MPPLATGQAYRLGPNRWGLRYRDANGVRRRKSPFPSKSAALRHYREIIEPELRGEPAPSPQLTLAELVELYLTRHEATGVRDRTISTLRDRLGVAEERDDETPEARKARERHAIKAFGDEKLTDLEHMADEIAGWRAKLPPRVN